MKKFLSLCLTVACTSLLHGMDQPPLVREKDQEMQDLRKSTELLADLQLDIPEKRTTQTACEKSFIEELSKYWSSYRQKRIEVCKQDAKRFLHQAITFPNDAKIRIGSNIHVLELIWMVPLSEETLQFLHYMGTTPLCIELPTYGRITSVFQYIVARLNDLNQNPHTQDQYLKEMFYASFILITSLAEQITKDTKTKEEAVKAAQKAIEFGLYDIAEQLFNPYSLESKKRAMLAYELFFQEELSHYQALHPKRSSEDCKQEAKRLLAKATRLLGNGTISASGGALALSLLWDVPLSQEALQLLLLIAPQSLCLQSPAYGPVSSVFHFIIRELATAYNTAKQNPHLQDKYLDMFGSACFFITWLAERGICDWRIGQEKTAVEKADALGLHEIAEQLRNPQSNDSIKRADRAKNKRIFIEELSDYRALNPKKSREGCKNDAKRLLAKAGTLLSDGTISKECCALALPLIFDVPSSEETVGFVLSLESFSLQLPTYEPSSSVFHFIVALLATAHTNAKQNPHLENQYFAILHSSFVLITKLAERGICDHKRNQQETAAEKADALGFHEIAQQLRNPGSAASKKRAAQAENKEIFIEELSDYYALYPIKSRKERIEDARKLLAQGITLLRNSTIHTKCGIPPFFTLLWEAPASQEAVDLLRFLASEFYLCIESPTYGQPITSVFHVIVSRLALAKHTPHLKDTYPDMVDASCFFITWLAEQGIYDARIGKEKTAAEKADELDLPKIKEQLLNPKSTGSKKQAVRTVNNEIFMHQLSGYQNLYSDKNSEERKQEAQKILGQAVTFLGEGTISIECVSLALPLIWCVPSSNEALQFLHLLARQPLQVIHKPNSELITSIFHYILAELTTACTNATQNPHLKDQYLAMLHSSVRFITSLGEALLEDPTMREVVAKTVLKIREFCEYEAEFCQREIKKTKLLMRQVEQEKQVYQAVHEQSFMKEFSEYQALYPTKGNQKERKEAAKKLLAKATLLLRDSAISVECGTKTLPLIWGVLSSQEAQELLKLLASNPLGIPSVFHFILVEIKEHQQKYSTEDHHYLIFRDRAYSLIKWLIQEGIKEGRTNIVVQQARIAAQEAGKSGLQDVENFITSLLRDLHETFFIEELSKYQALYPTTGNKKERKEAAKKLLTKATLLLRDSAISVECCTKALPLIWGVLSSQEAQELLKLLASNPLGIPSVFHFILVEIKEHQQKYNTEDHHYLTFQDRAYSLIKWLIQEGIKEGRTTIVVQQANRAAQEAHKLGLYDTANTIASLLRAQVEERTKSSSTNT